MNATSTARLLTGSGAAVSLDGAELTTFAKEVQLAGWMEDDEPAPVFAMPVLRAELPGHEPWAVYRAHWDVSSLGHGPKWVAVRWPVGAELPAVPPEHTGEAAVRLLARLDLEHRTTPDLVRQFVQWGAGMARGLRTPEAAERVTAAGGELSRRYRASRGLPGMRAPSGADYEPGPVALMHHVMRAGFVTSTAGEVRAQVAGYGGGDVDTALRMLSLSVLPGVLPDTDAAPVVLYGALDPVGGVLRAAWASETGGGEPGDLQQYADALPAMVRADPGTRPEGF
ncbi:hypothetical protein [Streptomyces sindenensis]|uniref:Uncharacterized protein n=2 Tax=Streptomyces sindenensis TaxID=67363 RepID=A0ABW6ETD6_9ACTN